MKTVLAAVDLSPISSAVIAEANELAKTMRARLVVLHVFPFPDPTSPYRLSEEDIPRLIADGRQSVEHSLTALTEGTGAILEAIHSNDDPSITIREHARMCGADYLVVGSHGFKAFHHYMVGGTVRDLVHSSPCPILIVHEPPPPESASRFADVQVRLHAETR